MANREDNPYVLDWAETLSPTLCLFDSKITEIVSRDLMSKNHRQLLEVSSHEIEDFSLVKGK